MFSKKMKAILEENKIAYAAGIFDGEGNIYIKRKGFTLMVQIGMIEKSRDILLFMQSLFGGIIGKVYHSKQINRAPHMRWLSHFLKPSILTH